MATNIIHSIASDDLSSWLYEDGFEGLLEHSNSMCELAFYLSDTDDDDTPSENCHKALRQLNDLRAHLSVLNLVKHHISILEG
jgi:hypothetical protein